MKSKKEYIKEWKYVAAVYSGIALLNAKSWVEMNREEKDQKKSVIESNMDRFFKLDGTRIESDIKKFNSLLNDDINVQNSGEQINIGDFGKSLIVFLRSIRNYYAHRSPSYKDKDQTLGNDVKFEQSRDEFEKNGFDRWQKYTSSRWLSPKNLDNRQVEIFVIQIFLTRSEFKEFLGEVLLLTDGDKFKEKYYFEQFHVRKWALRLKEKQFLAPLPFKVISYLNNFKETKSKKVATSAILMDIINHYLWKKKFKTSIRKSDESFVKKRLLFGIYFDEKKKAVNHVNYTTLRHIALNIHKFNKIREWSVFINTKVETSMPEKIPLTEKEKNKQHSNNVESFSEKLKKLNTIDNRELAKLVHKYMILNSDKVFFDRERKFLSKQNFELLAQSIDKNDSTFLSKELLEKLNIVFKISKNGPMKQILLDTLVENNFTQSFIKKELKSDLQGETDRNDDKKMGNTKKEEPLLLWNKYLADNDYLRKNNNKLYDSVFIRDGDSEYRSQKQILKYIAPVLSSFQTTFETNQDDPLSKAKMLKLFSEDLTQIISGDDIYTFLKEKVPQSSRLKIVRKSVFPKSAVDTTKKIDVDSYNAHHEIINSKLFGQIALLKGTEWPWKKVAERYWQYKKEEPSLVKMVIDAENTSKDFGVERDYVIHRTLSKFGSWENIKKLFSRNQWPSWEHGTNLEIFFPLQLRYDTRSPWATRRRGNC